MGHLSKNVWGQIDAVDLIVAAGFLCVVGGVAIRYDAALALIVFGVGLLIVGALATWRSC